MDLKESAKRDMDQASFNELSAKLEECFKDRIASLATPKCPSTIAVLLLSWDGITGHARSTPHELNELRSIFEESYHCAVMQKSLSRTQGNTRHWLTGVFAEFLQKYDAKDTLLIVYYGGHNDTLDDIIRPKSPEQNSSKDRSKSFDDLFWDSVSKQLDHTDADLMLLVNCRPPVKTPLAPSTDLLWSIISAASSTDLPKFTYCLTRSLQSLVRSQTLFTLDQLYSGMKAATSRDNAFSLVQNPTAPRERLLIKRLTYSIPSRNAASTEPSAESAELSCSLSLTLNFNRVPTADNVIELARSIDDLVLQHHLPIQHVSWDFFGRRSLRDCLDEAWLKVGKNFAETGSSSRSKARKHSRSRERVGMSFARPEVEAREAFMAATQTTKAIHDKGLDSAPTLGSKPVLNNGGPKGDVLDSRAKDAEHEKQNQEVEFAEDRVQRWRKETEAAADQSDISVISYNEEATPARERRLGGRNPVLVVPEEMLDALKRGRNANFAKDRLRTQNFEIRSALKSSQESSKPNVKKVVGFSSKLPSMIPRRAGDAFASKHDLWDTRSGDSEIRASGSRGMSRYRSPEPPFARRSRARPD